MDERQAAAIVRAMLNSRPADLVSFHSPVGGDDSFSFRFTLDGTPLLLKVKREAGTPVGLIFHQRIRAAGVPVPDLVAYSRDAGPEGQTCAVWTWVEGVPANWGGSEPCPYDEAELGEILRAIHDLPYEGAYGLLGDDPAHRDFASHPDLGATVERWSSYFDCEAAARRYRDKGYLDWQEAAALTVLPDRLGEALAHAPKALLHMGDIMHHGNLLVGTGKRIVAVLDYVESMVGDPRWELAWFDYYFAQYPYERPRFDLARFYAGYGMDHDTNDTLGRFYLLAILLFEKLLFFDPQSPRGAWAIRTVKRLLGSFG